MEDDHHPLSGDFDPLLIGILGCFAGVFIVATYHYITTRCTGSNRGTEDDERQGNRLETWTDTSVGNSTLASYRHVGNCKVDGMCAVCLSEFGDGEMIRVLPECLHSFHAPCIDMWLYSHSSCPLCRANTRLLPLSNLPRRFVPSSSHSSTEVRPPIQTAPATPEVGISEDTSPRQVTVVVPYLYEEPQTGTVESDAANVDNERTVPGPLVTSTSHSDERGESGQQILMLASTTSVTIHSTDSGDETLTEAESPVLATLHSNGPTST